MEMIVVGSILFVIVGLFCGVSLALNLTGFWLWFFALGGEILTLYLIGYLIEDCCIDSDSISAKIMNVVGTVFWGIALKLLLFDVESDSVVLALLCLAGLFIAPYLIVASLDALFGDSKVTMVFIGIAKISSSILLYLGKLISLNKAQAYNEIPKKLIVSFGIVSFLALLSFILIIMMPAVCSIKNWREESQKQKKIQKESKRKQIKEKYSYQLISAVEKNDAKMVASLLEKGADVNYKDFSGKVPLRIAMENNNKNMISLLLEKGAKIEFKDSKGCTILLNAVEHGNVDMVSFLLEKGAFINCKDSLGQTPLLMALKYNNKNMISLLLEKGAAINIFDSHSKSTLDLAIENEDADLVSLLLEKGAEIGNDNSSLKTALDFAIKNDNTDLLSLLAEKAAQEDVYCEDKPILFFAIKNNYKSFVEMLVEKDVHKKSRYDNEDFKKITPLFFATLVEDKDMVLLLLKNKVDVNERVEDSENKDCSFSPLERALGRRNKEIATILLENGADINCCNCAITPLRNAVHKNDKDMATFLLEKGANINYIASHSWIDNDSNASSFTATALSEAVKSNNEEMVSFLIEKGADINLEVNNNEEYYYTMLQEAVYVKNKKIVSLLLDAGADINKNSRNNVGTALINAVETKFYDSEIVSLLIEKGSDTNLESAYNGHTPLTVAVSQNNKDAVLLLLKSGANPNKKSSKFGSPLMIAFQMINKEMCSLLMENGANPDEVLCVVAAMPTTDVAQFFLDRGANVNCENSNGNTPLTTAISFHQKEMVLFLISNGANVNFERSNSTEKKIPRTPLESAINIGDAEIVSLLITYGADVNYKTKNGNTPLLFAALHGESKLVPILKEAGAISFVPAKGAQTTTAVAMKSADSDLQNDSAAFNSALVALSKIIAKNGAEIFSAENSQKLKALISDLIPQGNEIAAKVKQALSCGFAQIILDAADKSDDKKEKSLKKSVDKIIAETKLEKETAVSIVELVALSLGWDFENLNLE